MTITRAQIERVLIKRCGLLMTAANLDGTTFDGTNEDLNDPIGYALRACELTVADISAVDDADCVGVTADLVDKVLDVAELRLLNNIEGNLDQVDVTIGPHSERRGQLATMIRTKINAKEALVGRLYGVGLGTLSAGVIGLDIAETYTGSGYDGE